MAASQTLVFKLAVARGKTLRQSLNQDNSWEFRRVDHAAFQVRGEGTIATLYNSGKLVVQGRNADSFVTRYIGDLSPVKKSESKTAEKTKSAANGAQASSAWQEPDADYAGSDEAGKGDSFGGISVAAVLVKPQQLAELNEAGVCDSKRINDKRIRVLAPWIRQNFIYAERILNAGEYNSLHQQHSANVNKLLVTLHTDVLTSIMEQAQPTQLVVDRFGANMPVSHALKSCAVPIVEVSRAERWAAVAAASVLARESFLATLAETSEKGGIDLPLGSGSPVKRALKNVRAIHSPEAWPTLCKMHFKNVQAALSN